MRVREGRKGPLFRFVVDKISDLNRIMMGIMRKRLLETKRILSKMVMVKGILKRISSRIERMVVKGILGRMMGERKISNRTKQMRVIEILGL